MRVSVLVENTPWEDFEAEHGLALYVEHSGKQYLVDSGASGLYADNARKLGVNLASIDAIFYSGHCTGTIAFSWLKEVLGDRLVGLYTGKRFEL